MAGPHLDLTRTRADVPGVEWDEILPHLLTSQIDQTKIKKIHQKIKKIDFLDGAYQKEKDDFVVRDRYSTEQKSLKIHCGRKIYYFYVKPK